MIKAYIFDIGGTLEDVFHNPACDQTCGEMILTYLKSHGIVISLDPDEFTRRVEAKNMDYRAWSMESLRELSPYEVWSEWYLSEFQVDHAKLKVIADNVANLWERNYYTRSLRPESRDLLKSLSERGFLLGVISNTGSQTQVIETLHEYEIHPYFSAIYLSALSGYRKPYAGLFQSVAVDLGVLPEECAYVGDTISRDVRGARAAGYGATIRIQSHLTEISDARHHTQSEEADYLVGNLMDILKLGIADRGKAAYM